jgi:GAF domain-containing protein
MDGFHPASRKNTFPTRKPVKCFSYFFRGVGSYANCFLILPIIINKKLAAILSLGFFKNPFLSDADIAWAKDYTDRIAVALSNASWEETLYYQAHYDVLTKP